MNRLLLVWSRTDGHRVGERLLVDASGGSFGRSNETGSLPLYRVRGSARQPRPPLTSPNLSRQQLVLSARGDGVDVVRVGKRRVRIDGLEVERAHAPRGSRIEIDGELLFWVEGPTTDTRSRLIDDTFAAPDRDGFVGESDAMWALRDQLDPMGQAFGHVQITGPEGSGRHRAAKAMHRRGPSAWLFLVDPPEAATATSIALSPERALAWLSRADLRLFAIGDQPVLPVRHVLAMPPYAQRRGDLPLIARHILLEWSFIDGRGMARHLDDRGEPQFSLALIEHLLTHDFTRDETELRELLWRSVDTAPGSRLAPPTEAGVNVRRAAWEASLEESFDDTSDET